QLHAYPLERPEGLGDLEELQAHGLVLAQHLTAGDAEQEGVADLAGRPGDSDANGICHGELLGSGVGRVRSTPAGDRGPTLVVAPRAAQRARARQGSAARALPRWSSREPAGSELHGLDLEELFEAVLAVLAPVAAVLVAAEGRVRVEGPAVDLDLAGADPAGEGLGPLRVGAPHAAGQAVDRVVG